MRDQLSGGFIMATYKDDPRWITGKFGNCQKCGTSLKGKKTAYWPRTKSAYCEECGTADMSRFILEAQDEAMMSGNW
jgi:hypothetical protein